MRTLSFTIATFLAQQGAQAQLDNLADRDPIFFDSEAEFEEFHDCLALSPIIIGNEGRYFTSDIQFAQQIVFLNRKYEPEAAQEGKKLDEAIAMRLASRFFLKQREDSPKETETYASSLHVELDKHFTKLLNEFTSEYQVDPEAESDYEQILPQHHGYNFSGMYQKDNTADMALASLAGIYTDQAGNFAGIKVYDHQNKIFIADAPVDVSHLAEQNFNFVLENLTYFHQHTRLIGFRTSRPCKESKVISSVQPIYYSTDERMCTEVLSTLQVGQLEEIPSYGDNCAVHGILKQSGQIATPTRQPAAKKEKTISDVLEDKSVMASYLIIWAMFFMLLTMVCSRIQDRAQARKEEKREHAQELAELPQSTPRSSRADLARPVTTMANAFCPQESDNRKIEDAVDEPMDTQDA